MPGWLGLASGAVNVATSLFGNPDDARRIAEANDLAADAIAGNDCAYWKLRCLAGYNDQVTRDNARQCGHFTAEELSRGTECGYATDTARAHAKAKVLEVEGRRGIATGAAGVTAGAARVGTTAAADTYLTTTGRLVGNAIGFPGISPALLVGAAVVLFLVLKKGK